MNGRFSRLEFGSRPGDTTDQASAQAAHDAGVVEIGEPTRGAAHHHELADRAYRRGEFESALQLYTRALRNDRARVPAWVGQVQMLVELHEFAEGRLWSDKALELFKNNGELLAAKSQACSRQGDRKASLMCSDASVQAAGSSSYRWAVRGEVMLAGAEARARDCFEKSLAEPRADWFDRVVISRIYTFHAKHGAAAEFASLAVALAPAEPYAWLVQSRCCHALGNLVKAREAAARALEIDPRFVAARDAAARLDSAGSGRGLFNRLKGWLNG